MLTAILLLFQETMEDKHEQSSWPHDTGYGGSQRSRAIEEGATGYNHSNRPERQERLHFDMDTGKLVVKDSPEEQPVLPFRHSVPDRPVLDKMASQGFFHG